MTNNRKHKPVGFYRPIAPPVWNAPELRLLDAACSIRICRRVSRCCSSAIAGIAIGANFKIYLLRRFCSNGVKFFLQYRRHRRKKWWTRILNFVIFENFLKFSKRRCTVPLGPIWTIMVAAKLDHSRVLVTMVISYNHACDQVSSKSVNVEGYKCRSETDRQTRLKIRAL